MANPILKTMCKKEEQYEEGLIGPIEMDVSSITEKSEHQQLPMDRLWKRGSRRRRLREQLASKPLLLQNRHRLGNLLDRLVRAHNWKEASGVLSVLLKGTPQCGNLLEARRDFLIAMEIQRRLGGEGGFYPTKIKKTYEVLMSKLSWTKKSSAKRYSIQLELALFYISLGNIQEALNTTKFLVQDHDAASEPTVNLLHGMLLYETWYSSLPEDMKIKGFDACMLSEASDATLTDGFEEPEAFASSNGHIAIDIEDANNSSNLGSESSIGNGKNIIDLKDEVKQQNNGAPHATELYSSASEMNDDRPLNPHHHLGCSIFLAHGLEKDLLPARLDHLSGDLEDIIYSYRRLTNEHYDDAVKHLRQALHSSPPLLVAMLPLVQLLLLGDRVEDALMELENSCHGSNDARPFRLRARLMESFWSNQVSTICRCYEDALTRDPTCKTSVERLIKFHRIGNYDTVPLLEKTVLHLDATDGNSSIWEEFASCFLKIITCSIADYEDRVSTNVPGGSIGITYRDKIPIVFSEGQETETWKVRCRWWETRHFSKSAYLQEMQYGDWKLLASKAASASHIYGPNFGYVKAVVSSLTNQPDNAHLQFLQKHLQNSINLYHCFTELCSG